MSVQIKCSKTGANLVGTVGLYYTTNAAVPVLPLSLFTGITAGVPTLTTGWVKVPNTYPTQSFTASTTSASTPFSFSGFDATADANVLNGTAKNFAIAVTFNTMKITEVLTVNYISLVGGDIATRPAPQSFAQVLNDCKPYFQTSFLYGTTPAQNVGIQTGETFGLYPTVSGTQTPIFVNLPIPMRVATNSIVLYNPAGTNALIRNETVGNDWSGSGFNTATQTQNGFGLAGTVNTGNGAAVGNLLGCHWYIDARMGIV
jgi:hypothetical protein